MRAPTAGADGGRARPTRRGWAVLAASALLTAAGFGFGHREFIVLGGTAFAVLLLAAALVGRLRPMEVSRSVPLDRVAPGDEVEVRLAVSGGGPGRRAHTVADRVRGPGGTEWFAVAVDGGAESAVGVYRVPAERRGTLELGPVALLRRDPLGLVEAVRSGGGRDRVWIHPRWSMPQAMPAGAVEDPQGGQDGGRIGGAAFHGLREYVPGDDVRHIHWRSTARHGRLMVREHADTVHTRLTVVVDDRSGAAGGDRDALDEVAGAAAAICAAAVHERWACELRLVSGASREGGGHLGPLLDLLAEAEPQPRTDPSAEFRRLWERPSADTAVLVSASLTTAEAHRFCGLRDRYPRLVVVALRKFGAPLAGLPGATVVSAFDADDLAARWGRGWAG
ncbi:DUF58 domain-containing protein [Nocardiopsis sp. CNT-189]|uniref:DUF58 domain-containing protein n=1 Tax=Nocardiopsis oceanisediminis TaxID=2816862 RepID=UPI003B307CDE